MGLIMTIQEIQNLKYGDKLVFRDECMKSTVPYKAIVLKVHGNMLITAVAYPDFRNCSYSWDIAEWFIDRSHDDFSLDLTEEL